MKSRKPFSEYRHIHGVSKVQNRGVDYIETYQVVMKYCMDRFYLATLCGNFSDFHGKGHLH